MLQSNETKTGALVPVAPTAPRPENQTFYTVTGILVAAVAIMAAVCGFALVMLVLDLTQR